MEDLAAENKKKKKTGGFQSMNLIPPVFKAIMGKGFNVPTPVQRKSIPYILEGRDVVVCSRTGSGKTAAFIIPMVNKLRAHSNIVGSRALIISPTRELALQTHQVLKQFIKHTDLKVSLILGGHGFEGQFESLACKSKIRQPGYYYCDAGPADAALQRNGPPIKQGNFLKRSKC